MNTFIIIPIIVGVLCAIFGYFLGKLKANNSYIEVWSEKYSSIKQELQVCRTDLAVAEKADQEEWISKCKALESELAACKQQLVFMPKGERQPLGPRIKTEKPPKLIPPEGFTVETNQLLEEMEISSRTKYDEKLVKSLFGKKVLEDDLKIIEGIGPKIEYLLMDSGITNWKILASLTSEEIKEILDAGGVKFKMHDPTSWPIQAKMALEQQWQELKEWQDKHQGGKIK